MEGNTEHWRTFCRGGVRLDTNDVADSGTVAVASAFGIRKINF